MPYQYFLSIADIRLRLQTEQPLRITDSFAPFLTGEAEADIRAEFVLTDSLPEVPGRTLNFEMGRRTCVKENGEILRFFYATPDSDSPYATARWEEGNVIRVSYLEEGSECVSELSNSFAHLGIENLLIRHDRLCFHASCVETPLGGLLFTGPSGIGKSTQAELWCRCRDARQINGDRPALSRNGDEWLAWGMPYAGSSRVWVNDSCPVSAILLLRQEKQCSLRRLSAGEAFRAVWQGLAVHRWDRDFVEKASILAMELSASVPVFEFACTPDEAAVTFLEQRLRKERTL